MQIVSIQLTCHAAPVQYEGRLSDGKAFYFRARWDAWEFLCRQFRR